MILLKRFVLMLQFFTSIPIPIKLESSEKDFGKGLTLAPAVGALIGCILAAFYYIIKYIFPFQISAVLTVIAYIMLTGGLHMDGLGDTFDGIFSNRPKERMLEIMRDSRVGTNAVLAIICVVLINSITLGQIDSQYIIKVLILFPVAGRIGSLVGAGASSYARKGEGLGRSFIDYCNTKEIIIGAVMGALLFYAVIGIKGLFASIFLILSALIIVKCFSRKIGGATGDILGAVCELNQTIFILGIYILYK